MRNPLANSQTLLALTLSFTFVLLGMRVFDVFDTVSSGRLLATPALAEASKEHAGDSKAEEKKPEEHADTTSHEQPKQDAGHDAAVPTSSLAGFEEMDTSPAEQDVLKQLAKRREELDMRSREMDKREAIIKIAEQRVDKKIKDMEVLRQQLQTMVGQVGEAQATQIENLVKTFETMKPEEAARILETLDMPILLGLIQKMKPARTAPILAKMPPEKAKDLTIAITKQDQLPQIK